MVGARNYWTLGELLDLGIHHVPQHGWRNHRGEEISPFKGTAWTLRHTAARGLWWTVSIKNTTVQYLC